MGTKENLYFIIDESRKSSVMNKGELIEQAIVLAEKTYRETDSYIDLDIYNELKTNRGVNLAIAVLRMHSLKSYVVSKFKLEDCNTQVS